MTGFHISWFSAYESFQHKPMYIEPSFPIFVTKQNRLIAAIDLRLKHSLLSDYDSIGSN